MSSWRNIMPKKLLYPIERYIDNTWLKLDDTGFEEWVDKSIGIKFNSLCVRPDKVAFVAKKMKDNIIKNEPHATSLCSCVCTVINFPTEPIKTSSDVGKDIQSGLDELGKVIQSFQSCDDIVGIKIDYVARIDNLLSGNFKAYHEEISQFADRCIGLSNICDIESRVIIESSFIKDLNLMLVAAGILKVSKIDMLKSNTGYVSQDIIKEDKLAKYKQLINCRIDMPIKVAGGISIIEDAIALIDVGVDIIGTSKGLEIVDAYKKQS
jgi:deoxyribose-phosphate aldolase